VSCSYPDGVIGGMIGILYGGGDEWRRGWKRVVERVGGIWVADGDEVDFRRGSRLMVWFGKKIEWNGEGVSVLAEEMMKMAGRVERGMAEREMTKS